MFLLDTNTLIHFFKGKHRHSCLWLNRQSKIENR